MAKSFDQFYRDARLIGKGSAAPAKRMTRIKLGSPPQNGKVWSQFWNKRAISKHMGTMGTIYPVESWWTLSRCWCRELEGISHGSGWAECGTWDRRERNFDYPFTKLNSFAPPDRNKRTPRKDLEVGLSCLEGLNWLAAVGKRCDLQNMP